MWFDCFAARLPGKEYTPFSEICKQLKAEYGAEYLEESRIPSIKMMHQVNVANIAKEKGLPEKELQIRGLSIPVTEKTFCYTQGDFTPERDGLLYLAYEERTGYQSSNSNQLFLEDCQRHHPRGHNRKYGALSDLQEMGRVLLGNLWRESGRRHRPAEAGGYRRIANPAPTGLMIIFTKERRYLL